MSTATDDLERDSPRTRLKSERAKAERRARHLRIPVTDDEGAAIEAAAASAGLSIAAYGRAVMLGYEPRPLLERDQVKEILRVNGDLGRLGGLLKLWLTDDAKLEGHPRGQVRKAVLGALSEIDKTQTELRTVVRKVLRQAGG